MKIGITGLIIAVALLVVLVLTLVGSCVSAYNSEITLRTQVEAKVKEQGIVFDNTWKIIQQQAQVSQKYLDSFKEIYPLLMSERYKEGEAQLIFVRHIPPGTGNVATLSFTGNGQVASVPVSPVGNPGGLGGHWRAAVSPDDNARAVSETFDGVGPVEVSVSGTPPLILPATDAPRQILASCLQG